MKHTDETVIGYQPQPQYKIDIVNQNKVLESYVLDQIAKLIDHARISPKDIDGRCVALAKTKIEEAFMWLNRGVFQPAPIRTTAPAFTDNIDPKQAGDVYVNFETGGVGSPVRPPATFAEQDRVVYPAHTEARHAAQKATPPVWEDDEETEAVRIANAERDGTMEAHLAAKAAYGT